MKSTGSLLWYSLAFPDLPRLWFPVRSQEAHFYDILPKDSHSQANYEETSNKLTDYPVIIKSAKVMKLKN